VNPSAQADWSIDATLDWLRSRSSRQVLGDMGPRYGIHTDKAFGVPMAQMKQLAKQIGTGHDLALDLWETGWYEARTIAALIDDPVAVTAGQMDHWCDTFDNWAICDTVCFNLFDRTAPAWTKVDQWADSSDEFVKRAAFALLWSLALHDRTAPDSHFVNGLSLIEREADDGRNFVAKSLSMAMRALARRNPTLTDATIRAAGRLAVGETKPARSIGTKFLREHARSNAGVSNDATPDIQALGPE
jgi:3-methyladenine DNA glycosylase AlkD